MIRSAPDGYTLLLVDPALVINQTLLDPEPYDVFKDLTAISVVSSAPNVVVVSKAMNITTLPQLVAYGKANPGKLNYASPGVGTTGHLGAEMFKQRTGIDATHVPYKGSGAAFPDIINNKVQFTFSSIASALPFTSDNRVVPVAAAGESAARSIRICRRLKNWALKILPSTLGSRCSLRRDYPTTFATSSMPRERGLGQTRDQSGAGDDRR